MIDEIKLKKMGRLSPADLVQSKMSEHARVAMNVALRRSCKAQQRLLKQARRVKTSV